MLTVSNILLYVPLVGVQCGQGPSPRLVEPLSQLKFHRGVLLFHHGVAFYTQCIQFPDLCRQLRDRPL